MGGSVCSRCSTGALSLAAVRRRSAPFGKAPAPTTPRRTRQNHCSGLATARCRLGTAKTAGPSSWVPQSFRPHHILAIPGQRVFFPSPFSVHLEGVESLLALSASPICASSSTFLISISPKESESFCRPVATGCCPGRRMRRVREREPAAPRRSDTTCTDSRHTT